MKKTLWLKVDLEQVQERWAMIYKEEKLLDKVKQKKTFPHSTDAYACFSSQTLHDKHVANKL